MSDDLMRKVCALIVAVPHTRQCYTAKLKDMGDEEVNVCMCNREARIASGIIAAIEFAEHSPLCFYFREDGALAAFATASGVPRSALPKD